MISSFWERRKTPLKFCRQWCPKYMRCITRAISCTRHVAQQKFSQNFENLYVYKNWPQFNETLSLNRYEKPRLQKDRNFNMDFFTRMQSKHLKSRESGWHDCNAPFSLANQIAKRDRFYQMFSTKTKHLGSRLLFQDKIKFSFFIGFQAIAVTIETLRQSSSF